MKFLGDLFMIKLYGTVYCAKRHTRRQKTKSQGVPYALSWRIKAAFQP